MKYYIPSALVLLAACPSSAPDTTNMTSANPTIETSTLGATDPFTTEPDSSSSIGGEVTTNATDESEVTGGCAPGSEGCACVDGLCLGELQCTANVCGPHVVSCGKTINGDLKVLNDTDFGLLEGVSYITGSLDIGPGLGSIPQLSCLEEVGYLTLRKGNDYSHLAKLTRTDSMYLEGTGDTVLPSLAKLTKATAGIMLHNVSGNLQMPLMHYTELLQLGNSDALVVADDFLADWVVINSAQRDFLPLEGIHVGDFNVQGFTGTSLPHVIVSKRLAIEYAPSLADLSVEFSEPFPLAAPQESVNVSSFGLYISNTALKSLDMIASITTMAAPFTLSNNPELIDINGLSDINISLDYTPNEFEPSGHISSSPKLCLSHAKAVTDSMTVPTFIELAQLNEDC